MKFTPWMLVGTSVLALALAACHSAKNPAKQSDEARAAGESLLINGAGATFPFPLYSKWFSEFHRLHPELKFNYQSIGSGGGIQQYTQKTVDFGATDAPMTDEELARAPGTLHIPTVIGAVAVVYRVEGLAGELKLTPEVLADMFLGQIVKWNDGRIAALNPGVALPDQAISVVHRADGSGTTAIFTDYLAKVSPDWRQRVGRGKSVKWPVGLGGKGNEGVAGLVKTVAGSIGYVELAYAEHNHLATAALRNRAGNYVRPTIEGTSQAAAGVELPADYRVSLTDAPGAEAWPIASFTYLLVARDQPRAPQGRALASFLGWALHDGEPYAAPLGYAPLPASVVARVEQTLKTLTIQGKPISKH